MYFTISIQIKKDIFFTSDKTVKILERKLAIVWNTFFFIRSDYVNLIKLDIIKIKNLFSVPMFFIHKPKSYITTKKRRYSESAYPPEICYVAMQLCYEDVISKLWNHVTVSADTKLCSCARRMRSSSMWCIDSMEAIYP